MNEVKLKPTSKKPSQLEQFELFYEAVPEPEYLKRRSTRMNSRPPREKRLSRRRK